jgi:GT2 family glycosyltransferase
MSRGHGYVPGYVSAVIVCFNRLDLTQACLASIIESEDWPDEIVFVDNNSTDETDRWLFDVDCPIPIEVVTMSANVGWGRGANAGSQLAQGDQLLHLNNDTQVTPGWLTALKKNAEDGVAVVASRLVNPDGSLQHAGIHTYTNTNGVFWAENVTEEQDAYEPQAVSLAAALVRADAWNQLGGIDPLFRNGGEDTDFSLRARAAGWRLRYCPDSTVMHIASASGPERWTHVQDNIRLLHERWGS